MSVTERKHIVDMAIDKYGFNKVVSVVAISIAGALIACAISINIIPNDSDKLEKENK